jgi:hypothetical protein
MRSLLPKLTPRSRKILVWLGVCFAVVYVSFGSYIWWAMHQPPEAFGKVMARMPGPVVFLAFPFETLWSHARAGTLNVGDVAPDFTLRTVDKTERVQLSALNQQGPVVLVFGSYT